MESDEPDTFAELTAAGRIKKDGGRLTVIPKKTTVAELEALLNSEDDTPVTINPDGSIGPQVEDLCTAPGATDLTFGSLLCEMIRLSFTRQRRAEGLSPRDYASCNYCGGNDATRALGQRPSLELVKHSPDCSLAKHLPRLMAMANKDVT